MVDAKKRGSFDVSDAFEGELAESHIDLMSKSQITLADIKRKHVQNIPIHKIWVDPNHNYRKTFNPAAINELADSIARNGLLQPIVLIATPGHENGDYCVAAGERRFRAMRDKLKLDVSLENMVFGSEAWRFRGLIAVQENDQRLDVDVDEKILGYGRIIETECPGETRSERIKYFAKETGIPERTTVTIMAVYNDIEQHPEILNLVEEKLLSDIDAIHNLIKASQQANTDGRKKAINKFIELVKSDQVVGSIRKYTQKLVKFAKDGGRQPTITLKTDMANKETAKPFGAEKVGTANKPKKTSLKAKQLSDLSDKIANVEPSIIDSEWIKAANDVITALRIKLEAQEKNTRETLQEEAE
jgi:ParB/RepB/Spo0J family partition protein